MYEPGFSERFISWGNGGPALKAAWLNSAREVLNRPEAVAFISEGGILSCLAQVLDPDLIFRFVQGPSLQVTQYAQGESFLEKTPRPGERARFFTTDRVSFGEKLILVGHIPEGSPSSDTSLFPMPDVFEEESGHYRGMVGQGALNIIDNLFKDLDRGIIKARTRSQWTSYLRQNNKGVHAPRHIPNDSDFDEVGTVLARSFPITWQQASVGSLEIPEYFDPRAHRD
ncbi:hypothetical protein C8R44DRAFT_641564 [Mycena epipterygia]|nr:hypothetical protein C8R44DRAFT_641564 [Mycena epipterygia]